MKITKQKLKQIITEELKNVLNEQADPRTVPKGAYTAISQGLRGGMDQLAAAQAGKKKPQKPQNQPAEDKELEDIRFKADNLERARRTGSGEAMMNLRKKELNTAIDNYKGPSKDKAEMFRTVADVPLAGGQSKASTQYRDAAGTLPGPTSGMSRVGAPPLGGEVPGSRTASGPGGGGGAPTATTTKADTTKTTTKTKKVRRKVRKGRHDVKFQRMINRMEKAGDLSKSDWRKISRINVRLKDPARAKELFNQITGKTQKKIQKKMKKDAAMLGVAGGIEDAGRNVRADGSIDRKAAARSEQNAIELALATDRPNRAKAIQRLRRRAAKAMEELEIQANAEKEFGGGTVSPAATKARLKVDSINAKLSNLVQDTLQDAKDLDRDAKR